MAPPYIPWPFFCVATLGMCGADIFEPFLKALYDLPSIFVMPPRGLRTA